MKRKLLAFAALAVVLSLAAVSCGGKGDDTADTTASDVTTAASTENATTESESTTDAEEVTTAADEETTAADEETTVADEETTVADDETTVADDETTVADEETTVADEETTVADEETTVADEETTVADEETTVADEETSVEDEETTPSAFGDTTISFISDVASNENGLDLELSDLWLAFRLNLGASDPHAVMDGKYCIGGINELIADVDGCYAYSIVMDGVNCRPGALSYAFCRGVQDVAFTGLGEDKITDSFRPIGNYYEDDGDNMLGGAGIYATIMEGKLQIVIKYYDATAAKGVRNKYYTLNVDSNKLTFADDGNTVYILAGDKLCATIELSGAKDYDDIGTIPYAPFAETAKITLANGLVDTVENTMITATPVAQVGVASRVGTTCFSSVSIVGFSTVEIPEMVIDSMQVEQKSFLAGQPIYVIANGTADDYVGIYAEDDTLLNKVNLGGDRQINLNTETPLGAGTYTIRFMPNGATDVSEATVVETIQVVAATDMIYNIGDAGSLVSNNCFDAVSSDVDGHKTNLKADAITVPAGTTELKLWGWAGFKCESFAFGYIINDNAPVIKPEFSYLDSEDKADIAQAAAFAGGTHSSRHDIRVDLTGLAAGTYTIRAVAQQEDGAMTVLLQFTITIA